MSKNDVNSIEEAINILNNAIKCNEKQFEEIGTHILLQDNEQEAIKIVLGNLEALCDMQKSADRELQRQKQINEEHKKINGELREKVKELEKENHMFKNNKVLVNRYFKLKDNSIPKQKIKDRFEKIQLLYEKNLKEVDLKEVQKIDKKIFEGIRLEAQKDFARELLQESEDR